MGHALGIALLLATLACSDVASRPEAPPPAPPRCLALARLWRSEIVDDSTILFHMRDGTVWRNRLPRPCHGLRMQGGFGFETSLDELCDLDLIRVLGPTRGVCGLGRFEPYEPAGPPEER